MHCPAVPVCRSIYGKKKSKAYLFQFSRVPDTARGRKLKACHGMELGYVFGTLSKADGYNDLDFALSQKMMDYWTNFAKTGNPNGPGLVDWPAYTNESDMNLEFSDTIHTNKNCFKKECDFIQEQPPYPSR